MLLAFPLSFSSLFPCSYAFLHPRQTIPTTLSTKSLHHFGCLIALEQALCDGHLSQCVVLVEDEGSGYAFGTAEGGLAAHCGLIGLTLLGWCKVCE